MKGGDDGRLLSIVPSVVQELIRQGRLVEAAKVIKETRKVDLETAKAQVDAMRAAMERGEPKASGAGDGSGSVKVTTIPGGVKGLIFEGKKIEAVKVQRLEGGMGLKEAKDQVEAWEAELKNSFPESFVGRGRSRKPGCTINFVLLVVAAAACAALIFIWV